jgi:hypothetical protein
MIKRILFGLLLVPCLSNAMDQDNGISFRTDSGLKRLHKEDVSKVIELSNHVFVCYEATQKKDDCLQIVGTYLIKEREYRATYTVHGDISKGEFTLTRPLVNPQAIFIKLRDWYNQQSK